MQPLRRGSMVARAIALCVAFNLARSQEVYDLNAADAYTWAKSYPQSCECAENGASQSNCDLFKCNCMCDVSAGKCDYNCCCDPDCSADQISRFQALGACAFEGGQPDYIEYCYSSAELYGVNPKSPMGGQATAREAVGRALCVDKKNYAFRDEYFTTTDMQDSLVFSQPAGQKAYNYVDSSSATVSTIVPDPQYDQNDTLAAVTRDSNGNLVSSGRGYFAVPQNDAAGECNDLSLVTYENDVPSSTCRRTLSATAATFADQCVYQQSMQSYVSNLFVAKQAQTLASSGAVVDSEVLPVLLTAVTHEDWTTGALSDVTTVWTTLQCNTTAYPTSVASLLAMNASACLFASAAARDELLSAQAVCANFVKEVNYHVLHAADAAAAIVNITAQVVVTDVPQSGSVVRVSQTFALSFSSALRGAASASSGNLVARKRSGNPGYLLGLPVLFGQASAGVVAEAVAGFTGPAPAVTCPTSLAARVQLSSSFGYDSLTGCTLTLTRQQLKDLCCQGAPGTCLDNADSSTLQASPYATASGVPHFLNFSAGLVGKYGDADPLDLSQWFSLAVGATSDQRSWSDRTATCSNAYSGLTVQFLVAYSGERSLPQNKIVSALAQLSTSDWVFTAPKGDATATQTFALTATTSFVFQDEQTLKGYEPPAPPVLFKMPYDVFYPFLISAAPSSNAASAPLALALALAAALLCIWI